MVQLLLLASKQTSCARHCACYGLLELTALHTARALTNTYMSVGLMYKLGQNTS
jgi:hypothetical protein